MGRHRHGLGRLHRGGIYPSPYGAAPGLRHLRSPGSGAREPDSGQHLNPDLDSKPDPDLDSKPDPNPDLSDRHTHKQPLPLGEPQP